MAQEPSVNPLIFDQPRRRRSSSSSFVSASHPSQSHLAHDRDSRNDDQYPLPEMEGGSFGHRRRRSSQVDGLTYPTGGAARSDAQSSMRPARRKHDRGHPEIQEEGKELDDSDGQSDFSSRSTSDDVEMDDFLSDEGLEDDEETGLTKEDRKKRRRRKRRNTRLDSRVAGESKVSDVEKGLADQSVLKTSLINALLIGLWYLFSLSISIYNKWMFSKDLLDFKFPLFTTSVHMLVQFSLASLVLYIFPRFRPGATASHAGTAPADVTSADNNHETQKKPLMTNWFYATRIGPCGVATGLDIGLGNMSLRFITLSFFTMCKSSALGFVLIFAFLFRLEAPSIKLVLIIFTMTIGVIMMVAGETDFDVLGFALVISSAFFSGFRWALTQILLLRNPATSNPFSSIFFLAPIMFVLLLGIALGAEQPGPLAAGLSKLAEARGVPMSILIILFPGVLAFLMTASEFALLKRTSVVTLSICGIFKEVVTISAGGIVFHDLLTPINISGLLVTIASIAAYNYIKISKMRRQAREGTQGIAHGAEDGYAPVLGADPPEAGADDDDDDDPSVAAARDHRVSVSASGTSVGPRQLDLSIPSRILQEVGPAPHSPSTAASPLKKDAREED
ncbi:MAG: hypothetical protein M4579_000917 [Chaenotheca gracillima]|nr:MAG: hypothetical protein M4579_000917 [Chaenotheca gracillima]